MINFIRTITINGKPLVLRFFQMSDSRFEVSFLNDKNMDPITIGNDNREWKITNGENDEIRSHTTTIIGLLEEHFS